MFSSVGGLYSISISNKWRPSSSSFSLSPFKFTELKYGILYPSMSYEIILFNRETNKFLTFFALLHVKNQQNGFKIVKYSSDPWYKGDDIQISNSLNSEILFLSYDEV